MKRILKSILAFVLIVPFALLLTACGGTKSLEGNKYVYSKIETTGSVVASDYEKNYSLISFEFSEEEVVYTDGSETDTYFYKFEDGKLYLKAGADDDYGDAYGVISGKYLVITETVTGGTLKVYFKVK